MQTESPDSLMTKKKERKGTIRVKIIMIIIINRINVSSALIDRESRLKTRKMKSGRGGERGDSERGHNPKA